MTRLNNLRQRLGLLMSLAVLILLAAGCFNAPFDLIGGGDPPGGNGNGHEPAVYDGSACTGALGTVEDVLSCYAQYGTQSDWENFASLYSFPLVFVATLQLDEDSDIGGDELQAASTRQEVEAIP